MPSYTEDRSIKSHNNKLRASSLKGMASFQPFLMSFYHGGKIKFVNGALKGDNSTSSFTIYAPNEMRYEDFLNLVEKHSGIERLPIFTFRFTLHFNYCGKPKSTPITNDETLKVMFFLAKKDPSFRAQLHLEKVEVPFDELAELWTMEEIRDFYSRI
ncbi:hypothetical protein LXL04_008387 [Taraxacum kok-saghyz]